MGRTSGHWTGAAATIAAVAVAVALGSSAPAVAADQKAAQGAPPSTTAIGQEATPAAPTAPSRQEALLSRLHHAAQREIRLGQLGQLDGSTPSVQRYGAELVVRFDAFDRRVLALAADRGLSETRLSEIFAGENLDALRREAEDLARLGALKGAALERAYWAAVVQEQSAAADMVAAASSTATDPSLRELVAGMSAELDRASRVALAAVQAQPAEVNAPAATPVDTEPSAPAAPEAP